MTKTRKQTQESVQNPGMRQRPFYDLFVKYGFKQEAIVLQRDGKPQIGHYLTILDYSRDSSMFDYACSKVYIFLLGKDRNKYPSELETEFPKIIEKRSREIQIQEYKKHLKI
tara:strand:+ start:195 stop:530 length:336 start_codon:yes stop_codon:yes gene_type:complete